MVVRKDLEEYKDRKTRRKREDICLSLTDKQYYNLCKEAYSCGFDSVGEFMSAVAADLTDSYSDGSGESHLVNEWQERAFGTVKDTSSFFRFYLWSYDLDENVDELQVILDDETYFKERYQQYKEEACPGTAIEDEEKCRECIKKVLRQLEDKH